MAGFSAFSTTASANVTLNGINIAENCAAANINNGLREILAEGKQLSDTVAAINVASYMPLAGGAFSGNITRSGAGGYWYHANSAQAAAPVYTLPVGTALPASPAEGTIVFFY